MEIENVKTFETKAITSKGTFDVKVKIWEEITTEEGFFFGHRTWRSECTVVIDNQIFKADFNPYADNSIKSWAISRYYGMEKEATLRCDVSEGTNFINKIKEERRNKISKELEWYDNFNMIHDL